MPKPTGDRFTYADYRSWTGQERWELVAGQVHAMSPAPSTEHQRLSRRLFVRIANRLDGKPCEPFSAPFDVRLPEKGESDEEISTVVQPDIVVVCDPAKIDDRGCRGAPDLVVEIVSPSSASHDMIRKLALYEKHGVREYWVVQPAYAIILVYSLTPEGQYVMPVIHDGGGVLRSSAVPDLEIDPAGIFSSPPA